MSPALSVTFISGERSIDRGWQNWMAFSHTETVLVDQLVIPEINQHTINAPAVVHR